MVLSRPSFAQAQERPHRQGPVPGAIPVDPPADNPAVPFDVATGANSALIKQLAPAVPTVFVFIKGSSTLERQFLEQICKLAGRKVGVGAVRLKTGGEPIAARYQVSETPTAILFDRRGRFVARSSDAEQIRASIAKALGVMRIDWPGEEDPRYEQSAQLRRVMNGPA
jgi:hypothetical protein